MKQSITIIMTALICCLSISLQAQNRDIYRELNTPDPATHNRISINEGLEIKNIATTTVRNNTHLNGYRVRIFFDNGQQARTLAEEIKEEFEMMFPLVPCYLVYENPYFKVTVGNCLSEEEAIILLNRVQNRFDRAFVIREQITLESFNTTNSENAKIEIIDGKIYSIEQESEQESEQEQLTL